MSSVSIFTEETFVDKTTSCFFFKQKTAYEISACLVGSEMCIRDSVSNVQTWNSWWSFWNEIRCRFFQLCSEAGHGLVLSSCSGRIHAKNLSRDSLVA